MIVANPEKPKSPFRVLLEQASELGIRRIRFDVDVENYTENEELRWAAQIMPYLFEQDEPLSGTKTVFRGTNGQHALTELVAAKRYEVQQAQRAKESKNGGEKA